MINIDLTPICSKCKSNDIQILCVKCGNIDEYNKTGLIDSRTSEDITDELDNQGKVFISYKIEDTYIHDTKYGTKKLNQWICIKDYLKEIIKEELKVEKE